MQQQSSQHFYIMGRITRRINRYHDMPCHVKLLILVPITTSGKSIGIVYICIQISGFFSVHKMFCNYLSQIIPCKFTAITCLILYNAILFKPPPQKKINLTKNIIDVVYLQIPKHNCDTQIHDQWSMCRALSYCNIRESVSGSDDRSLSPLVK